MRVVCDNCGASYRIPDHKLVKEVNKATCRKCGEPIIIRRSAGMSVGDKQVEVDPDAATQVTEAEALQAKEAEKAPPVVASIPSGPSMGHGFGVPPAHLPEDAGPPTVAQQMDFKDETIPRQDLPESTAARPDLAHAQALPPPPPPVRASGKPSSPVTPPPEFQRSAPTQVEPPLSPQALAPNTAQPGVGQSLSQPPRSASKVPSSDEFSVEYTVVMMANFAAIAGAIFLVLAEEPWQRSTGLFVCLAGAILSQGIVITSDRGRRPADMMLSYVFGFLIAGSAAAALHFYENKNVDPAPVVSQADVSSAPIEVDVDVKKSDPVDGDPSQVVEDGLNDEEPEAAAPVEDAVKEPVVEERKEVVAEKKETPRSGVGRYPDDSKTSKEPTRSSRDEDFGDWDDPVETPSRKTKTPSSSSSNKSSSSGSGGVSVTVLKTMLTSNRNVKKCFLSYRKETGSMPSGTIKVRLTIQPSGETTRAYIKDGEYKNGTLDACLSRAVTGISFPPFDSDKSKTYTYPFRL